jgi:hypothetical protein
VAPSALGSRTSLREGVAGLHVTSAESYHRNPGGPTFPCGQDDQEGGKRSNRVTDPRNPTDQSIQSEANPRSRNYKSIIQSVRDQVETLV